MRCLLLVALLGFYATQVSADCCTEDKADRFCVVYNMLSEPEQEEVRGLLGENCDDVTKAMSKRKPNFLRFGRSVEDKPTFLRFGRASDAPNFLRFGRSDQSPHFLRFAIDASQATYISNRGMTWT